MIAFMGLWANFLFCIFCLTVYFVIESVVGHFSYELIFELSPEYVGWSLIGGFVGFFGVGLEGL